jgi:hypothetical protein
MKSEVDIRFIGPQTNKRRNHSDHLECCKKHKKSDKARCIRTEEEWHRKEQALLEIIKQQQETITVLQQQVQTLQPSKRDWLVEVKPLSSCGTPWCNAMKPLSNKAIRSILLIPLRSKPNEENPSNIPLVSCWIGCISVNNKCWLFSIISMFRLIIASHAQGSTKDLRMFSC